MSRSTVSKEEISTVLKACLAHGMKPLAVELLPGRVRFCMTDEFDLTLPDQAGELEKLKERLGASDGRKYKAA